ncbi:MAG: amidohydrolase family protein, partial [Acidobacteria bacterium]|nr:amidohydrolase family protein [Acidobacteriota bacterium]
MSVLFRDVLVYDPAAPSGMVGPTDVLVQGDRISRIGTATTAEVPPDRIVDGRGRHLLVPGLINAHFHSPANHLKGSVRSLPLELFMLFESPADPALAPTPREAYLRTMLGAIEMLQRGITSVQDDAFVMPAPTPEIVDAIAQAYLDSGIRATLALDQPELTEAEKLPFVPGMRAALGDLGSMLDEPAPASASVLLDAYDHL